MTCFQRFFKKILSILSYFFLLSFQIFLLHCMTSRFHFWSFFSYHYLLVLLLSASTPLISVLGAVGHQKTCYSSNYSSSSLNFSNGFAFPGSWLARWKCKFPWSDSFLFFVLLCSTKIYSFLSLDRSLLLPFRSNNNCKAFFCKACFIKWAMIALELCKFLIWKKETRMTQ